MLQEILISQFVALICSNRLLIKQSLLCNTYFKTLPLLSPPVLSYYVLNFDPNQFPSLKSLL